MRWRAALAFFATFLAAACGQSVDMKASLKSYHDTQPTYASLADLPYEPLGFPSEVKFLIDEKSPMVDLGALGKSYVKAFELPLSTTDYRVVIRSYVVHDGFDKAIFVPLVTFLDAETKPISTSTSRDVEHKASSPFDEPTEPGRYQVALLVTQAKGARYVLIHTSRELIEPERRSHRYPGPRIAAGFIFIPGGASHISGIARR